MKESEILIKARALIEKPESWIKHTAARGKSGKSVNPNGRAAICFCAVGAYTRISGHECIGMPMFNALKERNWKYAISAYNDAFTTTHEDVLSLYDRAIEIAEEKE